MSTWFRSCWKVRGLKTRLLNDNVDWEFPRPSMSTNKRGPQGKSPIRAPQAVFVNNTKLRMINTNVCSQPFFILSTKIQCFQLWIILLCVDSHPLGHYDKSHVLLDDKPWYCVIHDLDMFMKLTLLCLACCLLSNDVGFYLLFPIFVHVIYSSADCCCRQCRSAPE